MEKQVATCTLGRMTGISYMFKHGGGADTEIRVSTEI